MATTSGTDHAAAQPALGIGDRWLWTSRPARRLAVNKALRLSVAPD
jgi:hypothetical protein